MAATRAAKDHVWLEQPPPGARAAVTMPLLEMARLPLVPCGDVADADEETALLAADAQVARRRPHPDDVVNGGGGANALMSEDELRVLVDTVMMHYDQVLESHLEPLTDQQLMGICNLQQSSQQAEDALSQGMETLQQTLGDTLASAATTVVVDNVTNYMGQMAIAMAMLTMLENFLKLRSNINGELNCLLPWRDAMIFFADLLMQQTLQQMHRILATRQAAWALLVISDYFSRLRVLSSLWLARPRDARHGVAERASHRPRPQRHG
uniref:DOG1 domain-containing protein n=1 Tax=Oryza barthii TaxID=65489 RepID=A0A0D3H3A3_9ORYZ